MRCFVVLQLLILTGLAGLAGWAHLSVFDDAKRTVIDKTVARHVRNDAAAVDAPVIEDHAAEVAPDPADASQGETPLAVDDEPGDPAPAVQHEVEPPVDFGSLGEEVSLREAKALYDAGMADFIDARLLEPYVEGHIPGAFHIPPTSLQGGSIPPHLNSGILQPDDRHKVIYCPGGDCDASHLVRDLLISIGFPDRTLHIMTEGFPAWRDAGYPVEVGPDPFGEGG
ncbi:MAG: rhodanese-like domain-containing protein [Phycisphaerales bacterium]